jgi:hypothetical protein
LQQEHCTSKIGLEPGAFDATGHWLPTRNECSLEREQPFDAKACLGKFVENSKVYFLGNSVTRDLMFTMAAALNNSGVLRRDHQANDCVKSRKFDGDVGATCHFDSKVHNSSLRFGWFHWFTRNETLKPGDFCGNNREECFKTYFKDATSNDALWIMVGHEYSHYHWPPPSAVEQADFLASVRRFFPGPIVFAVPTPVFFDLSDPKSTYGGYTRLPASNAVSKQVFLENHVPTIDTANYCNNKSLYADNIHHSGREQPDGTALPGQLVLAHIQLFMNIVNEERQCRALPGAGPADQAERGLAFGSAEGTLIRLAPGAGPADQAERGLAFGSAEGTLIRLAHRVPQ